jgi:hypothetical protein
MTAVTDQPVTDMSRPTVNPLVREQVPAGDSYRCDQPVWVHRHGGWLPGVVSGTSPRAVLATYQSIRGRGTVVDTVSAEYVMPREPETAR